MNMKILKEQADQAYANWTENLGVSEAEAGLLAFTACVSAGQLFRFNEDRTALDVLYELSEDKRGTLAVQALQYAAELELDVLGGMRHNTDPDPSDILMMDDLIIHRDEVELLLDVLRAPVGRMSGLARETYARVVAMADRADRVFASMARQVESSINMMRAIAKDLKRAPDESRQWWFFDVSHLHEAVAEFSGQEEIVREVLEDRLPIDNIVRLETCRPAFVLAAASSRRAEAKLNTDGDTLVAELVGEHVVFGVRYADGAETVPLPARRLRLVTGGRECSLQDLFPDGVAPFEVADADAQIVVLEQDGVELGRVPAGVLKEIAKP